jgi:ribosomal protein L37E
MIVHEIVAAVHMRSNMNRFLKNVQVRAGAREYQKHVRTRRCGCRSGDVMGARCDTSCRWGDGGKKRVMRVERVSSNGGKVVK